MQAYTRAQFRDLPLAMVVRTRVAVGVIGLLFPVLLIVFGWSTDREVQSSMSAYYHAMPENGLQVTFNSQTQAITTTEVQSNVPCKYGLSCFVRWIMPGVIKDGSSFYYGLTRNIFVGLLFFIGLCLYALKGFHPTEDKLLTIAGLLAVGVAIFPMPYGSSVSVKDNLHWLHYFCAITFFLLVAIVIFLYSKISLDQTKQHGFENKCNVELFNNTEFYRWLYNAYAVILVLAGLSVSILVALHKMHSYLVLLAEIVGVSFFGVYWITKTVELYLSKVEKRLSEMKQE